MFLTNRYLPINSILEYHSKEINMCILDGVQVRNFLGSSLNLGKLSKSCMCLMQHNCICIKIKLVE